MALPSGSVVGLFNEVAGTRPGGAVTPWAARRPCAAPGCGELVERGRCPAHAAQYERSRPNVDTRRWYRTARWKRLRESVLNNNTLCVDCQREQPPRVSIATDVHHKRKHGGDPALFWDRTNLEGLCASHHSMHTARGE